ncbi:MAG: RNA polymerase sigma factor [Gammaproteobacteria bacterium]
MTAPHISNTSADSSLSSTDDTEILRLVVAQDRRAFEVLYTRYYPRLFRFAYRLTRRLDLIDEVINDAMLAVWQNAGSYRQRSQVSSWIFGIAYHKSLKALKRIGLQHGLTPLCEEELGVTDAEHADLQDWLAVALRQLPAEQRAVIELTYYYGYRYQEIADMVGCPLNTVKTRMFYARRRLQQLLPDLASFDTASKRHGSTQT